MADSNLKVGFVENGYYYKGGDPGQESSWAPVNREKPNFLESVGRGMMDVAQGTKQFGLEVADFVSPRKPTLQDLITGSKPLSRAEEYTKEVADELRLYEQGVGKDMDFGRLAGNVAATMPASILSGGAGPAAQILRAGASGAAGAGSMFVNEGESRLENAALGGILGGGIQSIPSGFRALKNAAKPSGMTKEAAETALGIGVRPTPAQATNSRTLQRIEAGLENTAGGGMAMEQLGRANQKAVNAEIAKRLGVEGNTLDRKVLGEALTKIEGNYKAALGDTVVKPDARFIDDLTKITAEFNAPGVKVPAAIKDAIDDMRFLEPMKAADYNKARALYGKKSIDAYRAGNSTEAHGWDALQEAVDEMAKRSLPANKQASLDSAREGYRILKTVEKAADPITGDVSPAKLVNSIRQKDPRGFLYGRGENPLMDVADASSFLKRTPDSFTASRLGAMAAPSILGGAYGAHQGGPEGAATGFLLGTAAPYALAKGYLGLSRPQSILGNAAQNGLNYLYPALGGMTAQP